MCGYQLRGDIVWKAIGCNVVICQYIPQVWVLTEHVDPRKETHCCNYWPWFSHDNLIDLVCDFSLWKLNDKWLTHKWTELKNLKWIKRRLIYLSCQSFFMYHCQSLLYIIYILVIYAQKSQMKANMASHSLLNIIIIIFHYLTTMFINFFTEIRRNVAHTFAAYLCNVCWLEDVFSRGLVTIDYKALVKWSRSQHHHRRAWFIFADDSGHG